LKFCAESQVAYVEYHSSGTQPFRHPAAGDLDLDLDYNAPEIPADPGLTIVAYSAEPGSPAQRAVDLLASRAATPGTVPAVPADSKP
jgi:hypothetical protein